MMGVNNAVRAKHALFLLLVYCAVWATAPRTCACTTVMAGRQATADGSVLMASSCDGDVMGLIYVMPAQQYPPGTKLPMYWNMPRPTTYREYQANVKKGYDLVGYLPIDKTYRLLVLPTSETMLPAVLRKIEELVFAGATVVGSPPLKTPSLMDYPACDQQLQETAVRLWGSLDTPQTLTERKCGEGCIYWGGPFSRSEHELYPAYEATAELLANMGVPEDFIATGPVRYAHRRTEDHEIYFVANKSSRMIEVDCTFRDGGDRPELWIPVTGEVYRLTQYHSGQDGRITIPMRFEPHESFFVVFSRKQVERPSEILQEMNFTEPKPIAVVDGPWNVSFDTKWGGPEKIVFNELEDWTQRSERGIKYYSGLATYRKSFDLPDVHRSDGDLYLDLGDVRHIATVRLNGKNLGVVWTAPWRRKITRVIQARDNHLEIEVANLWTNRLLGDQQEPDANVRTVQWPSGLLEGKPCPAGRYTFTTKRLSDVKLPLLKSGLLGPVTIQIVHSKR